MEEEEQHALNDEHSSENAVAEAEQVEGHENLNIDDAPVAEAEQVEGHENLNIDDAPVAEASVAEQEQNDAGGENVVALLEIGRDADGATIFLQHDPSDIEGKQMCVFQNEEGQSFIVMVDGSEPLNEASVIQNAIISHPNIFYLSNDSKLSEAPSQNLIFADANELSENLDQNHILIQGNDLGEDENTCALTTAVDSTHLSESSENIQNEETEIIFSPISSLLHAPSFEPDDSKNCKLRQLAVIAQALANQQTNCEQASDENRNDSLTDASESVITSHHCTEEEDSGLSLSDNLNLSGTEEKVKNNVFQNQIEVNENLDTVNAPSCSNVDTRANNAVSVIYSPLDMHKIHSENININNSFPSLNTALDQRESYESQCNGNEELDLNPENQITSIEFNHSDLATSVALNEKVAMQNHVDDVCLDLSYKRANILEVNNESKITADSRDNDSIFLNINNEGLGLQKANAFDVEKSSDDENSSMEASSRPSYIVAEKSNPGEENCSTNNDNSNSSTGEAENVFVDVEDIDVKNKPDERKGNERNLFVKPRNLLLNEPEIETMDVDCSSSPVENQSMNNMSDESNRSVSLKTNTLMSPKKVMTINDINLEMSSNSKDHCHSLSSEVHTNDSDLNKIVELNNVKTPIHVAETPCMNENDALSISSSILSSSCSPVLTQELPPVSCLSANSDHKKNIEDIPVVMKNSSTASDETTSKITFTSLSTNKDSRCSEETSLKQADMLLNEIINRAELNEGLTNSHKVTESGKSLVFSESEPDNYSDETDEEETSKDQESMSESNIIKHSEFIPTFNNLDEGVESNSKSPKTPYIPELQDNEGSDSETIVGEDSIVQNSVIKLKELSNGLNNFSEVINQDTKLTDPFTDIEESFDKTDVEGTHDKISMITEDCSEQQKETSKEKSKVNVSDSSEAVMIEETSVRPPKKTYIKRRKTGVPAPVPKLSVDKDKKIELFSCDELTDSFFNKNDEHNKTNDVMKQPTLPKDDSSDEEDDLSLLSGIKNKVSATYKREKKTANIRNLRPRSLNSANSSKYRSKEDLSDSSDDNNSDENLKLQPVDNDNSDSIHWGAYLMNASFNSPANNTEYKTSPKSRVPKKRLQVTSTKHLQSSKIRNRQNWNKLIKSSPAKSKKKTRVGKRKLQEKVKKQYMSIRELKRAPARKSRKPKAAAYRSIIRKYDKVKTKQKVAACELKKCVRQPCCRVGSPVLGTNKRIVRVLIVNDSRWAQNEPEPINDEPPDENYSCSFCEYTSIYVDSLIFHMKFCPNKPDPPASIAYCVNDMELRQRIRGEQNEISENGLSKKRRIDDVEGSHNEDDDASSVTSGGYSDSDPDDFNESVEPKEKYGFEENDVVWVRLDNRFWPGLVIKFEKRRAWVLLIKYHEDTERYKMSVKRLHSYTNSEYHKSILEESQKMAFYDQFMKAVQESENYARKRCLGEVTCGIEFFGISTNDDFLDLDVYSDSSMDEDDVYLDDILLNRSIGTDEDDDVRRNILNEKMREIDNHTPKTSHFTEEEVKKLSQCILGGHCNDQLFSIYKGESESERHSMFFSDDPELTIKLKHMTWFGPVTHEQIPTLFDYLHEEFKTSFGVEHHMVQYIYEVWIPEAIIKAISLVKDIAPEDASRFFDDEAYVLDAADSSLEKVLSINV